MKKSDAGNQFRHRPSISRRLSTVVSAPSRKKVSFVAHSAPGEKYLELKDFDYVIKDSGRKQTVDSEIIFKEGNKRNGLNTQLERDHLSTALKKEGLGLDMSSLENILHGEVTNDYIKCIYFTSAYIINNFVGARGPKSEYPQDVLEYVNQLFPLPSKIRQDYSKKVKKAKAPDYILSVEIIEAKNLIPTDPDGLSDPYCKIWMSDEKEIMEKTSVKRNTLNPKWKECFNFCLNDIKNDTIHIEVWDQDPKGFADNIRQIKNIKGLKGLRLFCRECCRNVCRCGSVETDDFVAKVDILVSEVYSEGFDSWKALKDVKNRSMDAQLHIAAKFKTLRPKHILDALKRHLLLLKVYLQQSIEEYKESYLKIDHWEQLLPPPAIALIFQHTVQSSLSLCEDILCRFIVFVFFIQNKISRNYHFLFSLTDETYEKAQELLATDHDLENCLENLYREAVNSVYEICKSAISNLHSIDFIEDENMCIEFEFALKCAILSQDIAGKGEFIWPTFKSEAIEWFQQLADEINNTASGIKTEFFSKTLTFILSYHSAVDKVIRNIFPNKSYTQFSFEALDSVLSENLKPYIADLSEKSLNSVGKVKDLKLREAVELFLKIKELKDYVIEITKISESDFQLSYFREWFGSNAIKDWFRYKKEIIIPQISEIVSNDNLESKFFEVAERLEKQSSSVKLTANLIQKELVQLRNCVFHPSYPEFDVVFLEVLHSVSLKYSECLVDLIHPRNIRATFQSTGKKKICTIANNLWSLSVFVQQTVSDTVTTVPKDGYDTKFCLRIACCIICADICKEFERDIVSRIENIVTASSKRKQNQSLKAYVNSIRHLFSEEAMPNMAFEVYLLFMKEIVKTVTKAVAFFKEAYKDTDIGTTLNKCWKLFVHTPNVATGLLEVLTETEKLCFVDNAGKLKQCLWSADYKMLKNELHESVIIS